ncbi:helix-turn-helix domain-containing protein [Laspinema olomoucense]|uniref:Helix-turn-helix domain-containing protein n=1 Tax=Laspinema olomoucense D3b TaxID=2953688 RepID=A0ABT2NDU4_9CYAN|nr:helix-turn-helix transcriptional regulator [Laspinema sp. D3b]MCT7980873.1 helix-turn-helix domain-containing protein [Laspinema sp. D3b]
MKREQNAERQEGGSLLEALRIDRTQLTQEELCRRCGIPLRTYARWVSGETQGRPTISQVKALCRELGVSIDELPDDFGPIVRSHSQEEGE